MGIFNIWGALCPWFTAKYRGVDPNLVTKTTLYVLPVTMIACTVSM
jgi:hypothetical protein